MTTFARPAASLPRLSVREGLHKIVSSDDTIVALSTPMGRSGIGVVRVSGSDARRICGQFLAPPAPLNHRSVTIGRWQTLDGDTVDEVVVVSFHHPHSYTGEDVVEISAHGNPIVLNKIITMIQSAGARIAAPGEFTLRAVAHGKMDLIQAEAVRQFIEAQTDGQARIALRQLDGEVSKRVAPLKQSLVGVIAHLEAGIDFAEDDVELPDARKTADEIGGVRVALEQLQQSYSFGRLLSTGARIVIVGRPNVGKSSLFNRFIAMERAIVTEIPGTTRDVLSEIADVNGIPVRFYDTAGVRETTDRVEKIGVSRTLETVSEADLVILVIDGSSQLVDDDLAVYERVRTLQHLVVANKLDVAARRDPAVAELKPIWISARTGEGLDSLRERIEVALMSDRSEGIAGTILTSSRQNETILRAIAGLLAAETALRSGTPHEMALLDLYESLSSLNELTGEITTEDILGKIFSTFCIGK
jgi:tRNA modification GTPase